jgi:hypothetical protein
MMIGLGGYWRGRQSLEISPADGYIDPAAFRDPFFIWLRQNRREWFVLLFFIRSLHGADEQSRFLP